jgi:hypothetical protein
MAAVDEIAALAKTFGEENFHLLCLEVRHRVQMFVQTRHEALAATLHHPGRLDSLFVVLKTLRG